MLKPAMRHGLLLLAACGRQAPVAPVTWTDEPGYRWRPLEVVGRPTPGFTIVKAGHSNFDFINDVPDSALVVNRIYSHGAGVAIGDVDGDGRPDIMMAKTVGRSALYRNDGNWTFTEITDQAGLGQVERAIAPTFFDADGDGDLDLLIDALGGPNLLYLNDGHGRFTPDERYPGRESSYGSVGSAMADVDGDGDLDIYTVNHKAYTLADRYTAKELEFENVAVRTGPNTAEIKEEFRKDFEIIIFNGTPRLTELSDPDAFYLNDGTGRFQATSMAKTERFRDTAGRELPANPRDFGLAARFYDINGDLAPELYVANDFEDPDQFWVNDGRGNFRLLGPLTVRNTSRATMALDFGDINRDGLVDFYAADMLNRDRQVLRKQRPFITEHPLEPGGPPIAMQYGRNTLFLGRDDGTFAQIGEYAEVDASGWTWGSLFLDVDLDGYEDILNTTGNMWNEGDADYDGGVIGIQKAGVGSLEQLNYALRNRGNLTFEDATTAWGFGDGPDIASGMAVGDLDGDGDLDVVISRLKKPALLLRNDSPAARIAIELIGRSPNTKGVGAKIRMLGGPVPFQEREVTAGGLAMSHSDYQLSFATGKADSLQIEVIWRDGSRSFIPNAKPNRLYQINQAAAVPPGPPVDRRGPEPLFSEATAELRHVHKDRYFRSEWLRQPLLPNSMAQLGPGLTWYDIDHDGDDDLIVAPSQTNQLVWFRNAGGRFAPVSLGPSPAGDLTTVLPFPGVAGGTLLIAGQSNYEAIDEAQALPSAIAVTLNAGGTRVGGPSPAFGPDSITVGPLAMADIDGDGSLEVFVGGRVLPGEYPKSPGSRIYRKTTSGWELDQGNAPVLGKLGMVSSAIFADLDRDHDPDLVLAIELGPITVLLNDKGRLTPAPSSWGFGTLTGRWLGIAAGDFDNDGLPDLVTTTFGRNIAYPPDSTNPHVVYSGFFDQGYTMDVITGMFDSAVGGIAPITKTFRIRAAVPDIAKRFPKYRDYADATVEELIGGVGAAALKHEIRSVEHLIWLNRKDHFVPRALPIESQLTASFGPVVADFDGDGDHDLFLSQNFFATERYEAPLDAGRGMLLLGDGQGGFQPMSSRWSGIVVDGDQRGAATADYDRDGRPDLVVAQNGDTTKLFRNRGGKAGVRVRARGLPSNPVGIGVELRMQCGDTSGPLQIVSAGGGYWSVNSPVTVLARTGSQPCSINAVWPDGKKSSTPVPPNAVEVTISWPSN